MLALAIGKSGVIENEQASRSLFADLESGNGIDAGIPVTDAPCLDDSTVRYQLDLSSDDHSPEAGESTSDFSAYLGGCAAAQRAELLFVDESVIQTRRAGRKLDFLMDAIGHGENLLFQRWGQPKRSFTMVDPKRSQ